MSEFLEDPSVLTKEKLKSELVANNVTLPSGEHRKDVYVQLYLQKLTSQNQGKPTVPDTFSSDEELPPPLVTQRSRSGRKATRKTDKPRPDDVDVTELTAEALKEQLLKYGVNPGPIMASTRKLYEKKLQKLLDQGPPEALPPANPPGGDGNQNGNTDSDQYSDKEEEPVVPEPEPVPVVEKPVSNRGKTPVTLRPRRVESNRVEEKLVETTEDHSSKADGRDILKEMFPNEPSTPTGIIATCRRPIRGAAGRPLKPSDFWLEESRVRRTEHTQSSYTESWAPSHMATPVPAPARPVTTPPAAKRSRRFLPVWLQLLLLSAVVGFVFFIYQAMETTHINPFGSSATPNAGGTGK